MGNSPKPELSYMDELAIEHCERQIELFRHMRDCVYDAAKYRVEAEYWRNQHNKTVLDDIRHGEAMMGGILKLAIHKAREVQLDSADQSRECKDGDE